MSDFLVYAKTKQHSGNCTRAEAFTMGQRSRQSEIDQLKAEKEELDKKIKAALVRVDDAKEGYYGFSKEGGDTDNLAMDLERALRGEHETN